MASSVWLLDIGNSKTKAVQLVVSTDGDSLNIKTPLSNYDSPLDWLTSNIAQIVPHNIPIFFSSVQSDSDNDDFQQKLALNNCQYFNVKTESKRFGLVNSYNSPEKMGVDRWLAMLGAKLITSNDYLVIDAGTAVTLDAVVDDTHIGGWITPGLKLSKDTLIDKTRRVSQAKIKSNTLKFGKDTEDCVHYGGLANLTGVLLSGIQLMRHESQVFDIVISGGDANAMYECIDLLSIQPKCIQVTNIVMIGLMRCWLEELNVKNVQKLVLSLNI